MVIEVLQRLNSLTIIIELLNIQTGKKKKVNKNKGLKICVKK